MMARRLWIMAVLIAATFGARPADGRGSELSKSERPSRLYTIELLMDTTRMSGASFSADETRIHFSSDRTRHGFNKEKNRIAGDRAILEVLERYLKPASRATPAG